MMIGTCLILWQVLPGTYPEVFYKLSLPEVVHEEQNGDTKTSQDSGNDKSTPREWTKWVLVALAFILVTALAIGLGVPLQEESRKRSSSPSTISNSSLTTSASRLIPKYVLSFRRCSFIFTTQGRRHHRVQEMTPRHTTSSTIHPLR